jgi:hypothetical protein
MSAKSTNLMFSESWNVPFTKLQGHGRLLAVCFVEIAQPGASKCGESASCGNLLAEPYRHFRASFRAAPSAGRQVSQEIHHLGPSSYVCFKQQLTIAHHDTAWNHHTSTQRPNPKSFVHFSTYWPMTSKDPEKISLQILLLARMVVLKCSVMENRPACLGPGSQM